MLAVLKNSLLALSCVWLLGCASAPAHTARPDDSDGPAAVTRLVDVAASLRSYLGDSRGDYLFADGLSSQQVMLAMSIPDSADGSAKRSTAFAGGLTLYFGCRQHSCSEKGAVVIDRDGHVVRAGLINFSCGSDGCLRNLQEPVLTIFVHGSPRYADEAERILTRWAKRKYPNIEIERRVLP